VKWRVVDLQTNSAPMNMALDEAISNEIFEGANPTIRFYRWKPSAVSIGYFQSLQDEVNLEKCKELGIEIVRRRTGGGAVFHDFNGEITYSIIGKQELFPKDLTQSYKQICGYLVDALSSLGMNAVFHPINDILVDGRKISGNAQTRRNGILLQHGTILYDLDVEKMFTVLKVTKEKISDKLIQSVKQRVTRVLDFNQISMEELNKALINSFTKDKEFEFGEYSEKELAMTESLVKERYANNEWNSMR
jgi:lipoate---protein ligase